MASTPIRVRQLCMRIGPTASTIFLESSIMHLTHVDLQTLEPQSAAAEERLGQSSSSQGPAQMPPVPLSTVVDIGPNDDPQQMPQLSPLISDSTARLMGGLSSRRPATPPGSRSTSTSPSSSVILVKPIISRLMPPTIRSR